jgi:hypothetical protein
LRFDDFEVNLHQGFVVLTFEMPEFQGFIKVPRNFENSRFLALEDFKVTWFQSY